MKPLTDRQIEFMRVIEAHYVHYGRLPSYREIMVALDIRSPNGVACNLKSLARKGLIAKAGCHYVVVGLTEALRDHAQKFFDSILTAPGAASTNGSPTEKE